ncbi:hypothetical protein MTO96_038397 [Rhipicephalus appendiculatus]
MHLLATHAKPLVRRGHGRIMFTLTATTLMYASKESCPLTKEVWQNIFEAAATRSPAEYDFLTIPIHTVLPVYGGLIVSAQWKTVTKTNPILPFVCTRIFKLACFEGGD